MSETFSPPGATYSQTNESGFRQALRLLFSSFVRNDRAIDKLLFIDRVTAEVVEVTVESGVLVVTPE